MRVTQPRTGDNQNGCLVPGSIINWWRAIVSLLFGLWNLSIHELHSNVHGFEGLMSFWTLFSFPTWRKPRRKGTLAQNSGIGWRRFRTVSELCEMLYLWLEPSRWGAVPGSAGVCRRWSPITSGLWGLLPVSGVTPALSDRLTWWRQSASHIFYI